MNLSDNWAALPVTGHRVGAVEYVLNDLESAIRGGVVGVGDRLPSEAALAARYSVSRAVIREVLRALEARGLTSTRTGVGTFVIAARRAQGLVFDGFSSAQLIEARPHIEVPAAGLAAIRRTEAQIEALQELIEEMQREPDARTWVDMDTAFHQGIAEASGNAVFATVLRSIKSALAGQSERLNRGSQRREPSDREHRAIVAAIARGSATEAEDAMQFHLDQVKDVLTTVRPDEGRGEEKA